MTVRVLLGDVRAMLRTLPDGSERKTIKFFSVHARERAKEHYGLDLSARDMKEIWRACNDGRAPFVRVDGECELFVWTFRTKRIVPALMRERSFILTFYPSDNFTAGTMKRRFSKKQVWSVGRSIDGRDVDRTKYSRAQERRRAIEEIAEADE